MKDESENRKRQIEFALWSAILAPPIAWLVQFQIIYSNVLLSCVNHTRVGLIVTSAISFAACVAGGLLGWRELGRNPAPDERIKSRRFMSQLGLMSAAMFSLVVIAQGIATVVISPCQQ